MDKAERQRIAERAESAAKNRRPFSESIWQEYYISDIPALLASLAVCEAERDEWKRRVEMAQFDDKSFYEPQLAKAQAELALLRRVAEAVTDYLAPHEAESHPGGGGSPVAALRLLRVQTSMRAWQRPPGGMRE